MNEQILRQEQIIAQHEMALQGDYQYTPLDEMSQIDQETYVPKVDEYQINEAIFASASASVSEAMADKTALGSPLTIPAAKKLSFKEKRQREAEAEEARKKTALGGEDTFAISAGLKKEKDSSDMLIGDFMSVYGRDRHSVLQRSDKHRNMLAAFGYNYRVKETEETKRGIYTHVTPLTEEDAEKQSMTRKFVKDYMSGDAEKRKPHLDRIVKDMLSVHISPEMLSREYLRAHFDELHKIRTKMDGFMLMRSETPEYFDALDEKQKKMIETRIVAVAPHLHNFILNYAALQGVDVDGSFINCAPEQVETTRRQGTEQLDRSRTALLEALGESRAAEIVYYQNARTTKGYTITEAEKARLTAFQVQYPFATYETMIMTEQIADHTARTASIYSANVELSQRLGSSRVDSRVLTVFGRGYLRNADGEPINAKEQKAKEKCDWRIQGLIAENPEERIPAIEDILQEVLSIQLSPAMFTDEYIIHHFGEFRHIGEQLTYFENLMSTSGKEYFDAMPPVYRDYIYNNTVAFADLFNLSLAIVPPKYNFSIGFDKPEVTAPGVLDSADTIYQMLRDKIPQLFANAKATKAAYLKAKAKGKI